jgi:integration host factor subunit alpha
MTRGLALAVTKADLADTLFNELGLNKREAKEFVELFFEKIRIALEMGESVKLSGFGNFGVREKNPRPGRNPKTGEEIPITARRVVTFKASQKLKDRVATNADMLRRAQETNTDQDQT